MRKRHPPFRRRKLAKKLRKLRLRARMSIQEAAKALDKDVQALYRIEAGPEESVALIKRILVE